MFLISIDFLQKLNTPLIQPNFQLNIFGCGNRKVSFHVAKFFICFLLTCTNWDPFSAYNQENTGKKMRALFRE